MGAAESAPRKLTIPNDSELFKITDRLAERILACKDGGREKEQKRADKKCPPNEFEEAVRDENIPPNKIPRIPPGSQYADDDLLMRYFGPSLTSLRILQAKEKELEESETYWLQRIQKLQENHSKLKVILEQEYKKAVDEINDQVPKPNPDNQFPCMDQKNKVLKCYNQHPEQALLCAQEVSQFADCVQNGRINSLRSKESSAC